ncbi:MAG: EAL domain-containing protein [Acidimicrobiales bacterium]
MVSDAKLSGVLSEFAGTMVTDFPIQAILDRLVLRIVEIMPVTSAGVTLISPGRSPFYIAASNDAALRYEKLQSELGEGPCLEAYKTGEAIAVPDLGDNRRFKKFAARAVEAGLGAVFTFPLRQGNQQLGALDLYREVPGTLDAETMAAAQTLADVTSAYLLNAQARADLRDSYDRARESSLHDPLTGLPNRVLFDQRVDHAIRRARRSGNMAAVLFVDLDRFKVVNDTYGHHVGDELLVSMAARLSGLLRSGDSLARLSGDEFVILCEDLKDPSPAEALASRIGDDLALPFVLSDTTVRMTASVGIAYAGAGDTIPARLLEDADAAMYQAKGKGGARHQVVDLREQRRTEDRIDLERDLQGASARGELEAHYQPIVSAVDGRITGVEALLRWAHPRLGSVSPMTVVPLAEKAGLMGEIGRWMLEEACRQRQRFEKTHHGGDFEISVNVSPNQLMSSDFAATVASVLRATDTEARLLTLEVTESIFIRDSERALVMLQELKRMGVRLALDDFGTGYSSLLYFKRFPVDVVKVDRHFVADLGSDEASSAIVAAVIALARVLRVKVVAEGVETAAQHREVASLGCESCQGFYFSKPLTADDLDVLLAHSGVTDGLCLPVPAA